MTPVQPPPQCPACIGPCRCDELFALLNPSTVALDSRTQEPSNQSLMTRATQMAERLKAPHTPPKGADVQFIYEQLKLVQMYASATRRL